MPLNLRKRRSRPIQDRLIASTIPNVRLVPLDSRSHILGKNKPAWPEFLKEINGIPTE